MGVGVNTTDPLAASVHGTNPQNLVEKITRLKIYASLFWKEFCFGLTAETLVDRAMGLQYIGGTYGGNVKPSKFLCLVLKMLQLQPEKEIIIEFIKNEDYKYVRVLGAFYLRLVGKPVDIYKYLELLYADYRKIRVRTKQGWEIVRVDEFIDELLTSDYSCDIALPRLPKRWHLEDAGMIPPRMNHAEDDLEDDEDVAVKGEEEEGEETKEPEVAVDDAKPGNGKAARRGSDEEAAHPATEKGEIRDSERERGQTRRDRHRRSRSRDRSPDRRRDRHRRRSPSDEHSDGRGRKRSRSADRHSRRTRDHGRRSRSRSWSRSRSPYRPHDRSGGGGGRRDRSSRRGYGSRRRSYSRSRSADSRDGHSHRRRRRRSASRSRSPERQRRHRSRSYSSPDEQRHDRKRKDKREKRKEAAKSKLFKTSSQSGADSGNGPTERAGEGSVEYWNEQRAKLGLKPLKP
uniref:Pre-mRNA-splicing factor 38 n=1 Tax=Rhizochromulina marina TaxID=1034831 RepID=A0A7S2W3S8_9STRA|mmetsp:Transcript_13663/g.39809  ORF Transcript_13663/g.39809 Transcript_13663/m.39809 type:complete len:459 (+) Transcript_13663:186-1562(+)